MNPMQILATLRGRRREAMAAFAVLAGILFAAAFSLPVLYTASASIVVNLKSADGLSGIALPGGVVSTHIATQMEVFQSERVLVKAAESLGLARNAEWKATWLRVANDKKPFNVWAAETLAKRLAVKPAPDSSVLTVSYTSDEREFAAATANAVVKAYVATNLEMRLEPARQYSQYFDERAALLRASLEQARAKLLAYQRSNNLVITDQKMNLEAERLQELNTKLTDAKLAANESSAHRARATSTPENMREALADNVVSSLSEELSRQEALFSEQATRLGANHPQGVELASRIAALKQRRDVAVKKTLGSIEIADKVKQSQLRTLEQDVRAQRSQVLDLEAGRVEAGLLEREIESTQRAYDAVLEKASQAALQSGDNQSEVSILSSASAPLDRPLARLAKLIAIAVGGAGVLSLLMVLVREQFDRKVRTANDITGQLGQLVLVTLPPMSQATPAGHALFSTRTAVSNKGGTHE